MRVLGSRCFRANPCYTLVLLDRATPAEQRVAGDPADDPGLYGVLRPQPGSGLELRSVSAETALLFLTLAQPGSLPGYVVTRLGAELERSIGRLVLDGVLEVRDDGEFVSGVRAGKFLTAGPSRGGSGRIGELSASALRYGQELVELPESLLALRLYCYGRRPVSAALRRRLVDETAVTASVGLSPSGSLRASIDAHWHEVSPTRGGARHWQQWMSRQASLRRGPSGAPAYKLYVSPAPDGLKEAIGEVASALRGPRGAVAFKVGLDLQGICRPDKLVAYFERLDDLQAAAAVLRDRLEGSRAHGVPFTAAITLDGLLSWGADRPAGPLGADGTSWRMWVTQRLAEYLRAGAGQHRSELEPWQFALQRLRLSGINTETWVPASGMWSRADVTS